LLGAGYVVLSVVGGIDPKTGKPVPSGRPGAALAVIERPSL
jgi:hypothetical protein